MIKRVQNLWGKFRQMLTMMAALLLVVFVTLLLLAPGATSDFISSVSGIIRLFLVGGLYAYAFRYLERHYHLRAWWQSRQAKRAGQVKQTSPEVHLATPPQEKITKPPVVVPEVAIQEEKIIPPASLTMNQDDDDDDDSEFWNMLKETANPPAESSASDKT